AESGRGRVPEGSSAGSIRSRARLRQRRVLLARRPVRVWCLPCEITLVGLSPACAGRAALRRRTIEKYTLRRNPDNQPARITLMRDVPATGDTVHRRGRWPRT